VKAVHLFNHLHPADAVQLWPTLQICERSRSIFMLLSVLCLVFNNILVFGQSIFSKKNKRFSIKVVIKIGFRYFSS